MHRISSFCWVLQYQHNHNQIVKLQEISGFLWKHCLKWKYRKNRLTKRTLEEGLFKKNKNKPNQQRNKQKKTQPNRNPPIKQTNKNNPQKLSLWRSMLVTIWIQLKDPHFMHVFVEVVLEVEDTHFQYISIFVYYFFFSRHWPLQPTGVALRQYCS